MTIRRPRVVLSILWATSTMLAAPSYAEPAGFPDLSGYQQVDAAAYGRQIVGSAYVFDTPDGLHCEIAEPHYHPLQFYCTGALPGVPAGVGRVGAATIPAEEFAQQSKDAEVSFSPPYPDSSGLSGPLLPPMHYITALNITCAVDAARMTACRYRSDDGTRQYGFVVSPNGSAIL